MFKLPFIPLRLAAGTFKRTFVRCRQKNSWKSSVGDVTDF